MVGEYGALCLERNRGGTEVIGNRSLSVQNIPMIDKCKLAALMQPRHATKIVIDSYNVRTLLLLIDCWYIHYYKKALKGITRALVYRRCLLLHTHTLQIAYA